MKDENVAIVKMDATANDVPPSFNVRGFPTIFWKPAGGSPVSYNVSFRFICMILYLEVGGIKVQESASILGRVRRVSKRKLSPSLGV